MTLKCPHCGAEVVRHRNLARKLGGAIGSIAGAASGASGILAAARIGMVVAAPTGPYGALMSAIAAATLRSIVGATIGCEVGAALGELIDEHILDNDACRQCGMKFRATMGRASFVSAFSSSPSWRYPRRGAQGLDEGLDEDGDADDNDDPEDSSGTGHFGGPGGLSEPDGSGGYPEHGPGFPRLT